MSLQNELRTEAKDWDEHETNGLYQMMLRAANELDRLTTELTAVKAERDALSEQVSTQKDWVLVPREPTEKMIDAGDALNHAPFNSQPTKEIYRAMIAAISKGNP